MKYVALFVSLLLTGCESLGSVTQKAADLSDQALEDAEFVICQGATIGSIRRHYNTPEKVATWKELCKQSDFIPIE